MTGRYEIKDRTNPLARGYRFTSLDRAKRELARAVPRTRFYILDRQAKTILDH